MVIYEDLPLYMRTVRDLIRPQIEKIRIDSREALQKMENQAFLAIQESEPDNIPIEIIQQGAHEERNSGIDIILDPPSRTGL